MKLNGRPLSWRIPKGSQQPKKPNRPNRQVSTVSCSNAGSQSAASMLAQPCRRSISEYLQSASNAFSTSEFVDARSVLSASKSLRSANVPLVLSVMRRVPCVPVRHATLARRNETCGQERCVTASVSNAKSNIDSIGAVMIIVPSATARRSRLIGTT